MRSSGKRSNTKKSTKNGPNPSVNYLYNGFERFKDHYLSSTPSRLASARFQYSVGDHERVETYLRKAYGRKPKPCQSGPVLPPQIIALLSAQEEDGRWHPSSVVNEALGGLVVPEPPEESRNDLLGWRWSTALVVAMLRRDCAEFLNENILYEAYQRAVSLVSDDLLAKAREALIPRDLYFPVDEELLRAGKWREGADIAMQEAGYQAFVNEDMKARARLLEAELPRHERESHVDDDASTLSSMTRFELNSLSGGSHHGAAASSSSTAPDVASSSTTMTTKSEKPVEALTLAQEWEKVKAKRREAARKKKLQQEQDWRHAMLRAEFNLLSTTTGTEKPKTTITDSESLARNGARRKQLATPPPSKQDIRPPLPLGAKDFSRLADVWQDIILNKDEIRRLRELESTMVTPDVLSWDASATVHEFDLAKKIPLAQLVTAGTSISAGATGARRKASIAALWQGKTSKVTKAEGGRRRASSAIERLDAHKLDKSVNIGEERKRREAEVVLAILAMEAYLKDVRTCIDRCLHRFRTCRLLRDRGECLEEVTAMLGHSQPPRPGYTGWVGKGVKGLHNVICDVVEAVVRWRHAIYDEEHGALVAEAEKETDLVKQMELRRRAKAMTVRLVPFLYNGENVILALPYVAEFLVDYPELHHHYGHEFPWKRNPFLRAITLDERAPTPRKGTRTVKIGDLIQEVEIESEKEARQQELLQYQHMNAKLLDAAVWWPGIEADKKHKERIRAAEKVILADERAFGKRLHLSYFSTSHKRHQHKN